jgi:DNA mismatch endonuclease (patch repair protein)
MTDVFSVQKRSEVMSRIRSSATHAEKILYSVVRQVMGQRWRIDRNVSILPGRPDITVPTLKLAIFVDGCFYHNCPIHGHAPKSNLEYWIPKLKSNAKRDKRNRRRLRSLGFSVWAVWEHNLEGGRLSRTEALLRHRLRRLIDLRTRTKSIK